MAKDFLKNIIVFAAAFVICGSLLFAVCQIPRSAIHENSRISSEYFSGRPGFPVLLEGQANTRMDNYADCVLFNVIYNVDSDHALQSIITAPYYRIEGNDSREDYASAVLDGKAPNNEYSRYWHGSQIFIRPLLTFADIEGIRIILFGLLAAMNILLAALLLRSRQYAAAAIYFISLIFIQFWMCAFTVEYVMSFIVMTAACIAVFLLWKKAEKGERFESRTLSLSAAALRDKRMTYIFIVSGVFTCFLDFLTAETLTFTIPFILFAILCSEAREDPFGKQFLRFFKWGWAWLAAYASMFTIKWALVYAVAGKVAFRNVLENAAYRIEGAVVSDASAAAGEAVAASQRILVGILKNIACLLPASDRLSAGAVIGITSGVLLLLAAALYLLRGEKLKGAFIGILLLTALIPYLRYLCLSNHAYIHYFFTYRAQMAGLMAIMAIMAFSLKPSYMLFQRSDAPSSKAEGRKNRTGTEKHKKSSRGKKKKR